MLKNGESLNVIRYDSLLLLYLFPLTVGAEEQKINIPHSMLHFLHLGIPKNVLASVKQRHFH